MSWQKSGLGNYFWDDEEEALDEMLKPAVFRMKSSTEAEILKAKIEYKKWKRGSRNSLKEGGDLLQQIEGDGLQSHPAGKKPCRAYARSQTVSPFTYQWERGGLCGVGIQHIAGLRKVKPDPVVEVHPETAQKYQLKEGTGSISKPERQNKAEASDGFCPDPRVIIVFLGGGFRRKSSDSTDGKNLTLIS